MRWRLLIPNLVLFLPLVLLYIICPAKSEWQNTETAFVECSPTQRTIMAMLTRGMGDQRLRIHFLHSPTLPSPQIKICLSLDLISDVDLISAINTTVVISFSTPKYYYLSSNCQFNLPFLLLAHHQEVMLVVPPQTRSTRLTVHISSVCLMCTSSFINQL